MANLVTKWFEKSQTCPQCRAKLSFDAPFVRDYILERIIDKYARTTLSAEEILEREKQVVYLPHLPLLFPFPCFLMSVYFFVKKY